MREARSFKQIRTSADPAAMAKVQVDNAKLMPRAVFWIATMVLTLVFPAALRAQSNVVIWNFNDTLTNSLGGVYNTFSRDPSWARSYLDPNVHLPPSGHSLRITVHRAAQGFCGFWANFYPITADAPQAFNARPYRFLTFWVKGETPGASFDFKLIDQKDENNEDAVPLRPLRAYLPRGISTTWQKVWIPLSDFPEIDPGSLVRLVLIFSQPGDYRFYLDDIGFDSFKAPAEIVSTSKSAAHHTYSLTDSSNAMWVWRTQEILRDPAQPAQLLAFCAGLHVREIYLSVNFAGPNSSQPPGSVVDADRLRALLAAAHHGGLKVQALAGTPEWAVTADHQKALNAVAAILNFNRASPPSSRFNGIHFDVEPYVLLGFEDMGFRHRLLDEFLEMVAQSSEAARRGGLPFSCDVPWWFFPAESSPDRQAMTLTFGGEQKTVGEHLLDLLGSVTIMDYRNQADGSGGIISFAQPAIKYAAAHGKSVFVGLETSAEQPTPVDFVIAMTATSFATRITAAGLFGVRRFHGYILHALSYGGTIFVGLGPPRSRDPQPTEPIAQALADLRQAIGAASNELLVDPYLALARAAVAADPEWTEFKPGVSFSQTASTPIDGFVAVNQTAPNITFHGLGAKVFEEQAGSVEEWLGRKPGFAGLGLHYYTSLQELMETP